MCIWISPSFNIAECHKAYKRLKASSSLYRFSLIWMKRRPQLIHILLLPLYSCLYTVPYDIIGDSTFPYHLKPHSPIVVIHSMTLSYIGSWSVDMPGQPHMGWSQPIYTCLRHVSVDKHTLYNHFTLPYYSLAVSLFHCVQQQTTHRLLLSMVVDFFGVAHLVTWIRRLGKMGRQYLCQPATLKTTFPTFFSKFFYCFRLL